MSIEGSAESKRTPDAKELGVREEYPQGESKEICDGPELLEFFGGIDEVMTLVERSVGHTPPRCEALLLQLIYLWNAQGVETIHVDRVAIQQAVSRMVHHRFEAMMLN